MTVSMVPFAYMVVSKREERRATAGNSKNELTSKTPPPYSAKGRSREFDDRRQFCAVQEPSLAQSWKSVALPFAGKALFVLNSRLSNPVHTLGGDFWIGIAET